MSFAKCAGRPQTERGGAGHCQASRSLPARPVHPGEGRDSTLVTQQGLDGGRNRIWERGEMKRAWG